MKRLYGPRVQDTTVDDNRLRTEIYILDVLLAFDLSSLSYHHQLKHHQPSHLQTFPVSSSLISNSLYILLIR